MSPRLRLWLIGTLAVGLSVAVAFGVADESYGLGSLIAVIIVWLVAEWIRGPLPDAWILAGTLVGYVVGNRGFAQISVTSFLPLLPAEAAMLACGSALILRWAFKQVPAMSADGLNLAIVAWIALAGCRLPLDLQRYGFLALRDFATVYYALFFFIAQALCQHEASRRLLRLALGVAFALLPIVSAAFIFASDFFLRVLTWRGVPVVFLKGDLAAAFLAGGFFYFWSWREEARQRWWLVPAAFCLLMSPNVGSPRSAMVGTVVVTVLWLLARRWRLLGFQAALVVCALVVAIPVITLTNRDFRETPFYSIYEHALSIVDFEGKGDYRNAETGDPGDNNRFRLVWWRTVADETLETNPIFGLGFGADLAARFLVEYNLIEAEDFNARSPHSVIMSTFGRTGIAGLVFFLGIAVMMARSTWPAFRLWDFPAMGLWSVVWVLWFSACFGVVLEGPMGAVLFWSVLGMAHDATKRARQAAEVEEAEVEEIAATVPAALPTI